MDISDCITLSDFEHEHEWKVTLNDFGVFVCKSLGASDRYYSLDIAPSQISAEKRKEILDFCLGVDNYDKNEKLSFSDIFLHGEFITSLNTDKDKNCNVSYYAEITKSVFNSLLISEQIIKPYQVEKRESYCKMYYNVLGVELLQIDNYNGFCTQYYIKDINA